MSEGCTNSDGYHSSLLYEVRSAIGTRRRLRVFDLSTNRLQGGIPVVLPCVALQMLDLA